MYIYGSHRDENGSILSSFLGFNILISASFITFSICTCRAPASLPANLDNGMIISHVANGQLECASKYPRSSGTYSFPA